MVLEDVFAAKSDMSPELLPAGQTNEQGSLEGLQTDMRSQRNRTFKRYNDDKPYSKQTSA
jgi:hypothetical protein